MTIHMAAGLSLALGLAGWSLPVAAQEDIAPWTAASVCNAAAFVYYFLETPAENLGEDDGWQQLKSPSGYLYRCRLEDGLVHFVWKNMSGGPMENSATEYLVEGEKLTIAYEGESKVFGLAPDGGWTIAE